MIKSMTGFGTREKEIAPLGKVCVELKSSNHKFLEIVFHLPEGFLFLEEKIKKGIESRIKRGRITCVVNIIGGRGASVSINPGLLKDYLQTFRKIKQQFPIRDEISINLLVHLPGVLSLVEHKIPAAKIWPGLKILVQQALDDLSRARRQEGQALYVYLKNRVQALKRNLDRIRVRFKKVIHTKIAQIKTDEERTAFLKDKDITEELERLAFHIRSLDKKLAQSTPVGKELDFIAQEMQREANTAGAKSCDALISAKVVQLKSQIEKIREQAQNIE